jgi:RNA recognition motif-containing protein
MLSLWNKGIIVIMTIYVGDLPAGITEEELRQEFAAFGEVTSIVMMNKDHAGNFRHSGYAFIEMPSQSEAHKAITALDGKTLEHGTIKVIQALRLSSNKAGVSHGNKTRGRPDSNEGKGINEF